MGFLSTLLQLWEKIIKIEKKIKVMILKQYASVAYVKNRYCY